MQRSYSYSRNGIQLDVNLHSATKPKDRQALQKVLKSKSSSILKNIKLRSKSQSKQKGDIGRLITRQIPSSFQKCHVPVQNINAIYNEKIQLTKKRHQYYSMKKFNPPCYFDTVRDFYQKQHDQQQRDPCSKLTKTMNSQKWLRTQSVYGSKFGTMNSSNKLLIPFEKQTQRPFYQKLKKLQQESLLKPLPTDKLDVEKSLLQKKRKLKKTHNFESYQKHDLLNPQKIATFSSGMNSHMIDLRKYKQKNQEANLKFDKFVNQITTRYDRDCTPWLVKLSYDCRDQITRAKRQGRRFSKQSSRKMNEVHSKYPMRIAM